MYENAYKGISCIEKVDLVNYRKKTWLAVQYYYNMYLSTFERNTYVLVDNCQIKWLNNCPVYMYERNAYNKVYRKGLLSKLKQKSVYCNAITCIRVCLKGASIRQVGIERFLRKCWDKCYTKCTVKYFFLTLRYFLILH